MNDSTIRKLKDWRKKGFKDRFLWISKKTQSVGEKIKKVKFYWENENAFISCLSETHSKKLDPLDTEIEFHCLSDGLSCHLIPI